MPKRIIRLPIASNAKTCGECRLLRKLGGVSAADYQPTWWCQAFGSRGYVGSQSAPNRAQECLDAEVMEVDACPDCGSVAAWFGQTGICRDCGRGYPSSPAPDAQSDGEVTP